MWKSLLINLIKFDLSVQCNTMSQGLDSVQNDALSLLVQVRNVNTAYLLLKLYYLVSTVMRKLDVSFLSGLAVCCKLQTYTNRIILYIAHKKHSTL